MEGDAWAASPNPPPLFQTPFCLAHPNNTLLETRQAVWGGYSATRKHVTDQEEHVHPGEFTQPSSVNEWDRLMFKLVLLGPPLFLFRLLGSFHSVICSVSISALNRRVSNPFQCRIPLSELSPLCSARMPLRVPHCCCDVKVSDLCGDSPVKAGDDT